MKKNKSIILILVIVIAVVLIILGIKAISGSNENTQSENQINNQNNSTAINENNKLGETKRIGNLEFINTSISSNEGESYLITTAKNVGSTEDGDKFITFNILDSSGNIIANIDAYLGTVNVGEETALSLKISSDLTNAYDFRVTEKE